MALRKYFREKLQQQLFTEEQSKITNELAFSLAQKYNHLFL